MPSPAARLANDAQTGSPKPPARLATHHTRQAATLAAALLAVLIVATRYGRTYYFYDEWSMLNRVLSTRADVLNGATLGYNGHLYVICYLVYKAQLALGLSNHALIWAVFCASLVALTVATAHVLHAAGVPTLPALAAGVLITYFGPGAQLMTFEFQFTMNAALACSLFAGAAMFTISNRRRSALLTSLLLLLAVLFDSATAFAGGIFVTMLVLLRWHDRWAILALAPAAIVGAVFSIASQNALLTTPATLAERATFALHLVLLSLGAIAGGEQLAGACMLLVLATALITRLRRYPLPRPTRDLVLAASVSALAMVGITAWSRAGLVKGDFFDFNRYIALVAVYCILAVVPIALQLLSSFPTIRTPTASALLTLLLAVVFILNAQPLTRYRSTIEAWMAQTRALLTEATWTMSTRCPQPTHLDPGAAPLGSVGPQVSVALLHRLEQYGALTPPSRPPVEPAFVTHAQWRAAADVCRGPTSPPRPNK